MTDLDYADDTVIVRESFTNVQSAANEMQSSASQISMKVKATQAQILDGEILQEVDRFKYLGDNRHWSGEGGYQCPH